MKAYLDAHDAFVKWLDGAAECEPTAAEVEKALLGLAKCAASRGMTDVHWMFVMDGLIAHAKRKCHADGVDLPGSLFVPCSGERRNAWKISLLSGIWLWRLVHPFCSR